MSRSVDVLSVPANGRPVEALRSERLDIDARRGTSVALLDPMTSPTMVEMFEHLPVERRESVALWFMVQRSIASHAGLELEEWFGLIEDSFKHPLDFGFIEHLKRAPLATVDADRIEEARHLVGGDNRSNALEGEGIIEGSKKGGLERELFDRFQTQKLAFDARRTNQPRGRRSFKPAR